MNAIIDFIEKHTKCFFLVILIASFVGCNYVSFKSFRNLTSDAIAISSILLAVLGVLYGVVMSLSENSPFFKRASVFNKDKFILDGIIKSISTSIYTNLIFICFSLLYDIAPPLNNIILKNIIDAVWITLFILIVWQTMDVVHLIYSIYTYEDNGNRDEKSET